VSCIQPPPPCHADGAESTRYNRLFTAQTMLV
jgi:hypothetical protein